VLLVCSSRSPRPEAVGAVRARALRGRHAVEGDWFDLQARGEELYCSRPWLSHAPADAGRGSWSADDLASVGGARLRVREGGNACEVPQQAWQKRVDAAPPSCPEELRPWLGEYGWDFDAPGGVRGRKPAMRPDRVVRARGAGAGRSG
jgi:hypothetical protein